MCSQLRVMANSNDLGRRHPFLIGGAAAMASRSFSNSLGPLISAQIVYGSWINDQRQTLSQLQSTGRVCVCEHFSAGWKCLCWDIMSRLVVVIGSINSRASSAVPKG